MNKKKLLLVMITCLVFIMGLTGCSKTVCLSDFMTVEFSGVDESGTASLNFDYSAYEAAVMGDKAANLDDLADIGKLLLLEGSINYEADKTSNLTNGDIITVTFKYSEAIAKEYKVKFTGLTKEYTVSGLKEKVEIDAFDPLIFNIVEGNGVYLDFKGVAPEAELEIRNTLPNSDPLSKIQYTADKTDNIKKGEEIVITASVPAELTAEGYVLKNETTTITCDNVAYYATDISQIDEEAWDLIKQQCADLKTARINLGQFNMYSGMGSGEFRWSTGIENFKYGNSKLITLKEGMEPNIWDGFYNKLIIEFSVDVNDASNSFMGWNHNQFKDIAGFFELEDIVINKEGKAEIVLSNLKIATAYSNYNDYTINEINAEKDTCIISEKELDWN